MRRGKKSVVRVAQRDWPCISW